MEDKIKFGLVVICFLFSLSYGSHVLDKKDAFLLRTAMLLTVIADYCLLLSQQMELGVAFFCAVQFLYNIRFGFRKAFLAPLALTLALLSLRIQILFVLSAMYALFFLISLFGVCHAFWKRRYPYPNNFMALLGMFLFAACDVNVALYNSQTFFAAIHARTILTLIWLFYLPAQALLAFSGKKFN